MVYTGYMVIFFGREGGSSPKEYLLILREVLKKPKWKFLMAVAIKRRPPLPLMALRDAFKNYLADFFRYWDPPPPLPPFSGKSIFPKKP